VVVAFSSGSTSAVGQARGVIDADVHELPADDALAVLAWAALQAALAVDAMPCPSLRDAPELFDVDVQQLAGVAALVAVGRLEWLEARELAQADALEDSRDRRQCHAQALGDLARRHPQAAQQFDDLHALDRRAMRNVLGR
jgi:hypothetical protein